MTTFSPWQLASYPFLVLLDTQFFPALLLLAVDARNSALPTYENLPFRNQSSRSFVDA